MFINMRRISVGPFSQFVLICPPHVYLDISAAPSSSWLGAQGGVDRAGCRVRRRGWLCRLTGRLTLLHFKQRQSRYIGFNSHIL